MAEVDTYGVDSNDAHVPSAIKIYRYVGGRDHPYRLHFDRDQVAEAWRGRRR